MDLSMAPNCPQKMLKPFIDMDLSMAPNLIDVVTENSPQLLSLTKLTK
jgi:hypothetical protein